MSNNVNQFLYIAKKGGKRSMGENQQRQVVVHNDHEFYLNVVQLRKPITIVPLDGSGPTVTLSEMECRALLVPPGVERQCQCCSDAPFPPAYPFIVAESVE